MKKRIIALVLCIFTIAALDVAMAETAGVREVDGKHYYFDAEGQMMTVPEAGLYSIDDVTYYFYADSSIKTVTSNG